MNTALGSIPTAVKKKSSGGRDKLGNNVPVGVETTWPERKTVLLIKLNGPHGV